MRDCDCQADGGLPGGRKMTNQFSDRQIAAMTAAAAKDQAVIHIGRGSNISRADVKTHADQPIGYVQIKDGRIRSEYVRGANYRRQLIERVEDAAAHTGAEGTMI